VVLPLIGMDISMNKITLFLFVSAGLIISPLTLAESASPWTLNSSIQRAMKVAPEMKVADAEIGKQQGKIEQADAWPNPSVSLQVDDSLGLEDNSGDYDVTQLAITQSLPFGRLTHQRQEAEAGLASAEAQRRHQQLLLEYKVAQRFHVLQLTESELQLAKKRLEQASRYQNTGRKHRSGDPLIRYLTPLETMRLDIVLQVAKQTMEVAEGEFNEAAASFKALLGMSVDTPISLTALSSVPTPDQFNILENNLQLHPAIESEKKNISSLQASVAVAKSKRFEAPSLTVTREEGYYASRKQDSTSVMLSVQVPLWNRNNGRVTQARYMVHQAQADLQQKQRELQTNLHKSYLHLGHLIEQAEHYRTKLLSPAQRVFTLTRKGFKAGELNILTLIDANNTYFDAQARYFELLHEGWLELAMVRMSAGQSLVTNTPMSNNGEVK